MNLTDRFRFPMLVSACRRTAALGLVVTLATATGAAQAPAPAAAPATPAATVPLLWRIEGATPAYLFGTIHVPDERVLALPAPVQKAFDEAGVLYTEIPMDAATQVGIMGKVMLPGDQKLGDVVGPALMARMAKAVEKTVGPTAPTGTASMLTAMMGRMKPWAAMSQLSLLEFLPDLYAGRQPLDMMLWSNAVKAGKKVDALETVDEQLAVFDAFSVAEQTRMLELTLDGMEKTDGGKSQTRALVETYLGGDLEALIRAMNDAMASDRELMKRFTAVALDARNRLMAERIQAKRVESPATVQFFAVGAAHYAGDTGIVALLEKRGLKVTRLR